MASAVGHGLVAVTLGKSFFSKLTTTKLFVLGIICSIFPDIDVLAFNFNIPYGDFYGHRGFTHSLIFALILAIIVSTLFFKSFSPFSKKWFGMVLFFFLCTAFHGLLDALTNGGLGVAFFSPFDNTRYFFPWRPIKVSPIGAHNFFSEWGLRVIYSELIWIGIPCAVLLIARLFIRKRN